jgi:hypothetical protein
MELKNLVGKHVLSGIEMGMCCCSYNPYENCGYIKFTLDGITYKAVEDPEDGYRSYMEELQIVDEMCKTKLPNIEVFCCMKEENEYREDDVLVFYDLTNGKRFLEIGTQNINDYYPYCVMDYQPGNLHCNDGKEMTEGENNG